MNNNRNRSRGSLSLPCQPTMETRMMKVSDVRRRQLRILAIAMLLSEIESDDEDIDVQVHNGAIVNHAEPTGYSKPIIRLLPLTMHGGNWASRLNNGSAVRAVSESPNGRQQKNSSNDTVPLPPQRRRTERAPHLVKTQSSSHDNKRTESSSSSADACTMTATSASRRSTSLCSTPAVNEPNVDDDDSTSAESLSGCCAADDEVIWLLKSSTTDNNGRVVYSGSGVMNQKTTSAMSNCMQFTSSAMAPLMLKISRV